MTVLALKQERSLIAAAQTDPGAFAVLYEQHVDRVYTYAWHCLHDRRAAEDVVSETFYRARQNLSRYAWCSVPVSAWLFRIASAAIATRYRPPATLLLDAAVDLQDRAPGARALALRRGSRRDLHTTMAALPLVQHQVLSLYYGHDLCYGEIALILERNVGAIKQVLYRARRSLHHRLCAGAGDWTCPYDC